MTSVLVVDGNSLAHRAWHAIRESPDAVGHFVTAGFMGMLGTAWQYGPYDGVMIAFDSMRNQRKDDFPEYKAHRERDEDLHVHLDVLPDHIASLGLVVEVHDGAEGDDVLASAAAACEDRGWLAHLLSGDRDQTALVSRDVTLLLPRGSMSDLTVYDPATVKREYGVRPDQYLDFAALRGDPSDGLAGCHGIGAKTGARLIRDYDDLVTLYKNLSILPPKIEACLRSGREQVERNRLVMTPRFELPVDIDRTVEVGVDLAAIDVGLDALGLGGAAGRLRWAIERPPMPDAPPMPTDADIPLDLRNVPGPVLVDAATAGEQSALF